MASRKLPIRLEETKRPTVGSYRRNSTPRSSHKLSPAKLRTGPEFESPALTLQDIGDLQHIIGNKAVGQLICQRASTSSGDRRAGLKLIQRFTSGQVVVEPSETYLWNPTIDESFSLRGHIPGLTAGQKLHYVVATNAPFVAIPFRAMAGADRIQLVAMDDGQVLAEFKVMRCMDRKGGSLYLTHMEVWSPLKGQNVGTDMMRLCIKRFGVFRIGTEPNLTFFKPTERRDEIELTDEGDAFIEKMLQKGVITYHYVFPMDYKEEFAAMMSTEEKKSKGK